MTEELMQRKLYMFILNSFGGTCLTLSAYICIRLAQPLCEFQTRRPSFHPTELHVGFGGAYSESEGSCFFFSLLMFVPNNTRDGKLTH